jgi:hypothetical protein
MLDTAARRQMPRHWKSCGILGLAGIEGAGAVRVCANDGSTVVLAMSYAVRESKLAKWNE